MKIVVFDLDETLGYFTQYGIFWDSLLNYVKLKNKNKLSQVDFNLILDLFPEYLRPNIINILKYLKNQKKTNCCNKMIIYTNNTGSQEWANHILRYFENKINYKLIDQLIAAFKINGRHVEICRTSYKKTHKDLIKCTKIPIDTEICFMDDCLHRGMIHENVYYINIKHYYYDLSFEELLNRFKSSEIGKKIIKDDEDFDNLMIKNISFYNYKCLNKNKEEYEIDKILGKHIIYHLDKFLNRSTKNKTYKNKTIKNKKNKTYKNITT